jgi:EF hand domain-containing protein
MKLIPLLCTLAVCGTLNLRADDTTPTTPATPTPGKGKGGHMNPEEMFKRLDTNHDNFLSKEEYMAGPLGKRDPSKAEKAYAAMDKAGDGKVTLETYKSFIETMRQKAGGAGAPKSN